MVEAKEIIGSYINHYNKERIHSSLNYRTPEEFAKECLCV
ncbi:MAG: integrase core domain-containing protein [Caldisericia bacterium]|nr:integrase core domain-containing protein [Caldisericia bacterium]